jgi:hypothetical protein
MKARKADNTKTEAEDASGGRLCELTIRSGVQPCGLGPINERWLGKTVSHQ